jgi:dTDP-4-dehydrorhamnose reductase
MELNLESGIYHACGNDSMSWFEFAKLIHSISAATCELEPIPTSDYPTPAKRPQDSRMSNEKLKSSGVSPWRSTESNLTEFIKGTEKETSL